MCINERNSAAKIKNFKQEMHTLIENISYFYINFDRS